MKTFTNELTITCNYCAIDKEYDIFQIRSSGKYIKRGSRVLDLGLNGLKSIAFDDGASAFVLFNKKSIRTSELQEIVEDDLMVKKLDASDLKPYILARLFLFALANSEYEDYSFSNLTGKLYLFKSEWISRNRKSFKALNIDIKAIDNDSSKITCSACTFSSTKLFKSPKILETYPRYVFSVKNTLKRVFDKTDESYIRRGHSGKKAEVPFISFLKTDKKLCKAYLVLSTIERFNRLFEKIIHIELKEREIERKIDTKKDSEFFDKIVELLIGETIYLTNMDDAQEDKISFEMLVERTQELLPLTNIVVSKGIKTKEMNIVLIHNQDYYKDNDLPDPYSSFDRSTPIQCVTLEDACNKDSEVIYKTIIKELLIKNEIINGRKFIIDDWSSYGYSEPWIFGVMSNNDSYFMKVMPNGDFKLIKKNGLFTSFKEEIYTSLERVLMSVNADDKMVVFDDKGNINLIVDSGLIPLPNKEMFVIDSPRSKESRASNLSGVLDINLYQSAENAQYSAGLIGKGVNTSIPTAPHIYSSKIETGEQLMPYLLETLGVQFVKYNSFTVLPYPFKYIREWVLMENKK